MHSLECMKIKSFYFSEYSNVVIDLSKIIAIGTGEVILRGLQQPIQVSGVESDLVSDSLQKYLESK